MKSVNNDSPSIETFNISANEPKGARCDEEKEKIPYQSPVVGVSVFSGLALTAIATEVVSTPVAD